MKLVANKLALRLCALLAIGAMPVGSALAHRPMAVDDAGGMAQGDAKLEFGWSRDDEARGYDGAAGYVVVDGLELEVSVEKQWDHADNPTIRARGAGLAAKWVPIAADHGLSMGLKAEYGKAWAKASGFPEERGKGYGVTGLLTWTYGSGAAAHVNLGRGWEEIDGDTDAVNGWGLGVSYPVTARFDVAAEVFGLEDGRPDRQVGVRYEVAEGVQLSAAFGRGNDRSFANAGIGWEF